MARIVSCRGVLASRRLLGVKSWQSAGSTRTYSSNIAGASLRGSVNAELAWIGAVVCPIAGGGGTGLSSQGPIPFPWPLPSKCNWSSAPIILDHFATRSTLGLRRLSKALKCHFPFSWKTENDLLRLPEAWGGPVQPLWASEHPLYTTVAQLQWHSQQAGGQTWKVCLGTAQLPAMPLGRMLGYDECCCHQTHPVCLPTSVPPIPNSHFLLMWIFGTNSI